MEVNIIKKNRLLLSKTKDHLDDKTKSYIDKIDINVNENDNMRY